MAGVDSLIRASVRMLVASNEAVNVLYFKQLSAGGDMGGLSDAIKTTLYDVIKQANPPNWQLADITISEQVPGGGAQLITSYGTAGVTGANADSLTTSCVVSLRTALAGRSHRGRQYVPVTATGQITNGVVAAGLVTAFQNAYDAFKAIYGVGGTDTDYQWGVWSRKLGDIVTGGVVTGYNVAAGFFPINAVRADSIARVQRRREVGVGA